MIKEGLLAELKFEADSTRKLFDAIPDDVLDYQPNDFNWTIAQLASHTAELYNWWDITLNQDVLELDEYKYDKGDISSMENIKAKLEENIAGAVACLENYDPAGFHSTWEMQSGGQTVLPAMPRLSVIRSFLMNHLYHHRGELIALLRVCGKRVPGLYGPTYEEQAGVE